MVTVDEETRLFRMRRGGLEVVVNFGDADAVAPTTAAELLFETESGVDLGEDELRLPAHAGAVLLLAPR